MTSNCNFNTPERPRSLDEFLAGEQQGFRKRNVKKLDGRSKEVYRWGRSVPTAGVYIIAVTHRTFFRTRSFCQSDVSGAA